MYFRWCEYVVASFVEATYRATMIIVRRLHQMVWPVDSPLGTEASPSFELVVHGSMGEMSRHATLESSESVEYLEATYEELEDQGIYSEPEGAREEILAEDEGVCMEGDAGFAWGDTRVERWKWEEENGEGDYRKESEEEEEIFEFQWGDEEEDWG